MAVQPGQHDESRIVAGSCSAGRLSSFRFTSGGAAPRGHGPCRPRRIIWGFLDRIREGGRRPGRTRAIGWLDRSTNGQKGVWKFRGRVGRGDGDATGARKI